MQEIASGAMRNCTSLTKLVLPESLRTVGDNAFNGCSGMKKIIILGASTVLANSALSGMSNLEDVYVPWRYMEKSGEPWGITTATINLLSETDERRSLWL